MSITDFDEIIARSIAERRAAAAVKGRYRRSRWSLLPVGISSGVEFERGQELCFRRGRWFVGEAA